MLLVTRVCAYNGQKEPNRGAKDRGSSDVSHATVIEHERESTFL